MEETKRKNKVVKAGIGYTIGNYLIKGLSFLTIPIFSRLMTTFDYGLYNTYIAYESIFCIFMGMALHMSVKNGKYKFQNKMNDYFSSCLLLILFNFIFWIIVGNIFYPLYSKIFGFSRIITNILVFQSCGSSIITFYNCYVSLEYKYKLFLKVASINAISNILLSIFLISVAFKSNGFYGRVIGTSLPIIVISIAILFYFFKRAKPIISKTYWKYALNYSWPIIPHGIGQIILSQFDRIMINSMIGSSEAGIYSFSYNIYLIINVTATSLDNVWGPWFYERMNAKDYKNIKTKANIYAMAMLFFSILIILVSPELVLFLGSAKYAESVYTVIPIVLSGYFVFLYTLPAQLEYYYSKTQYIALGTVIAAVINIILNYIFIARFGYVAAAYNTLITYILYFIFHYIIAWRVEGKCIFSTFNLVLYALSVLLVGAFSLYFIKFIILRWFITFLILVFMSFFTYKFGNLKEKIKVVLHR